LFTNFLHKKLNGIVLVTNGGSKNYLIRNITPLSEQFIKGQKLDTTFSFVATDFGRRPNFIEGMDSFELKSHINREDNRGADDIHFAEVEYYQRFSFPYAMFVLTIIGVAIAFRKVRGGIGLQIVAGILLSFSYIMFMKSINHFGYKQYMPAQIAVWIPNIIYSCIAVVMVKRAQL
jgi:lipopolysaccharide export system permease protein